MKKLLLPFYILLTISTVNAQDWKPVNQNTLRVQVKDNHKALKNAKIYALDRKTFDDKLTYIASRYSQEEGNVIKIPNAQGHIERFVIWEASNFTPETQAKFPALRSYVGKSLEDSNAYLRLSTGPSGISSTIFREGNQPEFMETYSSDGQYFEVHTNGNTSKSLICSTPDDHPAHVGINLDESLGKKASDKTFRTYRLALSVTGEYAQYFGGTVEQALEAMNNTMTRVNGVFEKDMAINFVFSENIEQLIFLDPKTDPYSNSLSLSKWNLELQRHLTNNYGNEKYDIGHLFGDSGGGGNAGCIGCICSDPSRNDPYGKGSGYTSPLDGPPSGDGFDINFVVHEIGHQVGANHSFSFKSEMYGVNVEPGSGSSIMGYAGITNYDVQKNSDAYFTNRNIQQVQANLASLNGCGIARPILNTPPQIELTKTNYTIPVGTAFKLDATVTDAEGDHILTNWEQNDNADYLTVGANSRVSATKTKGPNFRSFAPVPETYRYFPKFQSILKGTLTRQASLNTSINNAIWESVTTVPRVYNFTVTARDQNPEGPQTQFKTLRIQAIGTEAFTVLTPNTTDAKLPLKNETITVTWDVAATNTAPINTEKVKISISWDNGETFQELGIVNNTGTANFPQPSDGQITNNGFIMIEAIDNIFLAVKPFSSTNALSLTEATPQSNAIQIYPNPSKGHFTIAHPFEAGNIDVQLIDLTGRVVFNQNSKHLGGLYSKNFTTHVAKGVYILQIKSNNNTHTSKLIID